MKTNSFDYKLPKEFIAQEPIRPRDHSRLLVVKRGAGLLRLKNRSGLASLEDKYFYDIVDYLKEGDVLVLNNSKVFPARLIGNRKKTGGRLEIFLHHFIGQKKWNCLVGGRRIRPGLEVEFGKGLECIIKKDNHDGTWEVEFNKNYKQLMLMAGKTGQVPLPPYIKRPDDKRRTADKKNYQTIYADDKKIGSVAAPTAGFHFTPLLLSMLSSKGVQVEYITLHVGMGTFAPVKVDNITEHKMHAEYVEIKKDVLKRVIKAKKEKRRIIAVGTTSVRSLEAFFNSVILSEAKDPAKRISAHSSGSFASLRMTKNFKGWVDIFIYPGYEFKIVDAMITNFHLPKSTLLMLVSAFAGKSNIDKAYRHAIKNKYRFYSYGDAMFIY